MMLFARSHMVTSIASQRRSLILMLSLALMSPGCSKKQDGPDAHLARANEYFASQQYREAENEYREVLKLASQNPVAIRQLGLIYQDQGQVLQAFPLLKKAAESDPNDLEVQLKLGQTYLAAGGIKEAREAALHILDKQSGNEQALVLLADTAVTPNDLEEVRKLIEALRAKDQDRPAYHLALGYLALRAKNQDVAENEFHSVIKSDPKSATAHIGLGNLYWARSDLKSAGQEFKTAADLSPPRSLMRLRYADFLMKTGATAEATSILEDITRKAPDYLPVRVELMKIACAEHRDDACGARVQNILAQDPLNYDALFEDGILSAGRGELAKSIREFEYLTSTYSQNAPVRYQLAIAYLLNAKASEARERDKSVENAENRLTEAVKLAPHFTQAVTLLAELKTQKGLPAAAVALLTPLTKEQPQIMQAHYLLASAYLAQQQADQALAVYRQMEELFPKDPQPPYLRGMVLLAQRQSVEARKAFEKSLEISREYLPAAERLVDLDLTDKQYPAALDHAQKLIEQDPKQAQAWALRGKIYLAQRDFTRAEPDIQKAIELNPKLEPAYLLLAELYVASNKQEQAIEKLTTFVDNNKDDKNRIAPALLQLAFIQQNLKHFNEARDDYEKVLASAPNFAPALNNLAVLYADNLGQPDKAYDLAKRARENAPADPHSADTLGWILYKRGDYGSALPLLQESASKLRDDPNILFHLGMTQYMVGAAEPARLALAQAAEATTDFPGKEEARRRLSLLAIDAQAANTAEVHSALESHLREQPNDPEALLRLGEVQEREGVVDQAVKTYQTIVDRNPQFAPAVRRLTLLYSQRSSEDVKFFDLAAKAHQTYPSDPDITRIFGIVNYRRGFYPQAAELLSQAATKQKDNPELFYYLGEANRQLKEWSKCDSALQRAVSLSLSPKLSDEAHTALSECSMQLSTIEGIQSYRSGHYQQSAKLLADVASKRKDDPEVLYYLGQAYHQLKQLSQCKDTLQRALNLNLSPEYSDEAKRALADCS